MQVSQSDGCYQSGASYNLTTVVTQVAFRLCDRGKCVALTRASGVDRERRGREKTKFGSDRRVGNADRTVWAETRLLRELPEMPM